MTATFYYDIVCPYAYLAFSFLNKQGVFKKGLELKPILLGGLFKHMEVATDPNKLLSPLKADYLKLDLARQADFFGEPLRLHPRHPLRTVSAMRLLYAVEENDRLALTEKLYQAYFQENLDIDDEAVLQKIAVSFKMADLEQAKLQLQDATAEAFSKRIFGVPTITINDRFYFGGDRLALLQKELGFIWPDAAWQKTDDVIDFYFDFSSPYSYLAWIEVRKAQLLGVKFNLKPILLGALFNEIGMMHIPMLHAHPHKTAYYVQDMHDFAHMRDAAFNFSSHFPLRTVLAGRLALVDPATINAIFHAAWAQNRDIGDVATLHVVLTEAGFQGEALIKATEEQAIKEQLKQNTAEALSRGVFGVPTFFVRGQQVFGQDRFSWMRRLLQD